MAAPKLATFPAIRGAIRFYKIASIVTGSFLLLLCLEMILKYTPIHLEFFVGGPEVWPRVEQVVETANGLESTGEGINLSLAILVVHGWLYVVYLFACFRLWSMMRWNLSRFLLLALGGVIPLLTFFMESRVVRDVNAYLARREADDRETNEPGAQPNSSTETLSAQQLTEAQ